MMFAPIDPTSSRGFLRRRLFESLVVLGAVFLLGAFIFSWAASLLFSSFTPLLIGNVVAGLIAYYAYLVWNRQPMRIRCEECDESILCRTPWVCGECGHENWDVKKFPFIHQCENCHLSPKSYVCHHCDDLMFLSEDRDATNPARRVNAQGRQPKKEEKLQQQFERSFEEKKRNIESAKLDLTEAQIRAQIKVAKKGGLDASTASALEMQLAALKEFMDSRTATREAARLIRLQIDEVYKNNKLEHKKRNREVDEWLEHELSKATK